MSTSRLRNRAAIARQLTRVSTFLQQAVHDPVTSACSAVRGPRYRQARRRDPRQRIVARGPLHDGSTERRAVALASLAAPGVVASTDALRSTIGLVTAAEWLGLLNTLLERLEQPVARTRDTANAMVAVKSPFYRISVPKQVWKLGVLVVVLVVDENGAEHEVAPHQDRPALDQTCRAPSASPPRLTATAPFLTTPRSRLGSTYDCVAHTTTTVAEQLNGQPELIVERQASNCFRQSRPTLEHDLLAVDLHHRRTHP